ncbi:MAG: hypothetical protein AB7O44_32110 [Hyphomicrobiaceae bacterium]
MDTRETTGRDIRAELSDDLRDLMAESGGARDKDGKPKPGVEQALARIDGHVRELLGLPHGMDAVRWAKSGRFE